MKHSIISKIVSASVVLVISVAVLALSACGGKPSTPTATPCQTADTIAAAQGAVIKTCKVLSSTPTTVTIRQVGSDGTVFTVILIKTNYSIASVK